MHVEVKKGQVIRWVGYTQPCSKEDFRRGSGARVLTSSRCNGVMRAATSGMLEFQQTDKDIQLIDPPCSTQSAILVGKPTKSTSSPRSTLQSKETSIEPLP